MPLLEAHHEKIEWSVLCLMEQAVPFLERFQDKIRWDWLSFNDAAIDLLKANRDKIHGEYVSKNKCVDQLFELDYPQMRDNALALKEELATRVYDPDRLTQLAAKSGLDLRTYIQAF
jgi:hypothetical protein